MRSDIAIFRHAKANTVGPDLDRELTLEGERYAQSVGKKIQIVWQCVLSSPALRAQQTAYLLTQKTPTVLPSLYCSDTPSIEEIQQLSEVILQSAKTQSVLVVSHAPIVGPLIASIVQNDRYTGIDISSGKGILIHPDNHLSAI
ncbi:histidine phosphatase family protein [Gammaproteobacteria bacterium]|nr:histidine phosphatase family protein [Gammaproteobacteria bacterium]